MSDREKHNITLSLEARLTWTARCARSRFQSHDLYRGTICVYCLQDWATHFYLSLFCIPRKVFTSVLKGKAFPLGRELAHSSRGCSEEHCEAEELMQGCHETKTFRQQWCAWHSLGAATKRLWFSKALRQMFIPIPLMASLLMRVPNSSQVGKSYWWH